MGAAHARYVLTSKGHTALTFAALRDERPEWFGGEPTRHIHNYGSCALCMVRAKRLASTTSLEPR